MNDIAQGQLSDALARMNEALRILDEADAPGDIGGHVGLAIARLEERLGVTRPVLGSLEDKLSRTVKEASLDAEKVGDAPCARDIAPV